MFMDSFLFQQILIALAVGISSGVIGAFVIVKRMALVGDALSHVALPGIALAIMYNIDPFLGVVAFLFAAAFFIWWLEGKTMLSPEALVGILFSASLAVGVLIIPDEELIESLFGAFPAFQPFVLFIFLLSAVIFIALTFFFTKQFLFAVVSPDLSRVHTGGRWYDLLFFLFFSAIVALGIKLVGTLLMGALTIIPAAIAKNIVGISNSIKRYIFIAAGIGGFQALLGALISRSFDFLPGPSIILLGVAMFALSLIITRDH